MRMLKLGGAGAQGRRRSRSRSPAASSSAWSIARALVNDPAILLADEPTGQPGPGAHGARSWTCSTTSNVRGTTVVVATHDRTLLERYQKRTVRLERGRIVSDEDGVKAARRIRRHEPPAEGRPTSGARRPRGHGTRPSSHFIAVTTIAIALFAAGLVAATLGGRGAAPGSLGGEVQVTVYLAPALDVERARRCARGWQIASGRSVEAVPVRVALSAAGRELGDRARVLDAAAGEPAAALAGAEVDAPEQRARRGARGARGAAARACPASPDVDYGTSVARARSRRFVRRAAHRRAAWPSRWSRSPPWSSSRHAAARHVRAARGDRNQKLVGATDASSRRPSSSRGSCRARRGRAPPCWRSTGCTGSSSRASPRRSRSPGGSRSPTPSRPRSPPRSSPAAPRSACSAARSRSRAPSRPDG